MLEVFAVLLGIVPALPTYFGAKAYFVRNKPVIHKTAPSAMTPLIEHYHQQRLEIEGKVVPAAIEQTPAKAVTPTEKSQTVMDKNYAKWAANKAQIPLIQESIKVLETLSAMSSLKLSVEEHHSLEVLSNQTEELISGYFSTPETIRTMPAVERALHDQLVQIEEGVSSIKVKGADSFIRNLKVGTEFIKTKFNSQ